jgi:pyruvate kinase
MKQRTKIVATLGPASESSEVINTLLDSGVNVFRFNLKHNNYEWHGELMKRVREIAKSKDMNVGIMSDLQGPELRTGNFPNNAESLTLEIGQEVTFGKGSSEALTNIPFDELNVIDDLDINDEIYIDDGKIELDVVEIFETYVRATVKGGGVLGNHKSISIPQATVKVPTLNEKDMADIKFSIEQNVDFVALSFVRDRQDIATLRQFLNQNKGRQSIIAKVETLKAVENLDGIIDESDAVMVARGDLGIEVPIERVPKIQKQMIKMCREQSKPVIVATQMLLSMVKNAIPSRAEVADIANSVFDKTDALMLSEESATGDHPIKAVNTMAKIARYNEGTEADISIAHSIKSFEEMIIESSVQFSRQKLPDGESVKAYIIFTESGKSARVLSRFRSPLPIYAFCSYQDTVNRLALSFGVRPFNMQLSQDPVENTRTAIKELMDRSLIFTGDRLIVIFGNNVGVPEANNTLSIIQV